MQKKEAEEGKDMSKHRARERKSVVGLSLSYAAVLEKTTGREGRTEREVEEGEPVVVRNQR